MIGKVINNIPLSISIDVLFLDKDNLLVSGILFTWNQMSMSGVMDSIERF